MELVKINDLAQLLALADDDSFVIGSGDNAQRITWAELKTLLSELYSDVNAVSNHDSSDTAHGDIRDLIADMVIELRSEASSHNSSKMAHADIRDLIKELAAEASRLNQSKSNAIVRTLKGKAIVATDSSKAGFEGLRIFGRSEQGSTTGKNLLDMTGAVGGSSGGITVTNNSNGSYTYAGTATDKHINVWLLGAYESTDAIFTLKAGTYYIKGVHLYYNSKEVFVNGRDGGIITLAQDKPVSGIRTVGAEIGTTYNETWYPIIARSDVEVPWEPYTGGIPSPNPDYPQEIESVGDGGSVGVGVSGKNLLEITAKTQTMNGVTFTVNDDGSITVKGTATAACYYVVRANAENIYKGCKLSGCPNGGSSTTYSLIAQGLDENYKYQSTSQDNGNGVEIPNTPNVRIEILVRNGVTVSNATFHPMIRLASIADDTYEPYQKQSAIFTTPNGLPGIKVTNPSLATYTDENRQMWCADEIDVERGVYVQRVYRKVLTGNEAYGVSGQTLYMVVTNIIGEEVMSNSIYSCADKNHLYGGYAHGIAANPAYNQIFIRIPGITTVDELTAMIKEKYNNGTPVEIHYILETPIETPLSTEEIAKYKALHTNYPTTTVMNDCGADMEVGYVADPANHISQNYVPKASYTELEARVSALEQLAINS